MSRKNIYYYTSKGVAIIVWIKSPAVRIFYYYYIIQVAAALFSTYIYI